MLRVPPPETLTVLRASSAVVKVPLMSTVPPLAVIVPRPEPDQLPLLLPALSVPPPLATSVPPTLLQLDWLKPKFTTVPVPLDVTVPVLLIVSPV